MLDIILEAIQKQVENFTALSSIDFHVFTKMEDFSTSLKESILKLESSPKSSAS